MQLVIDKFGASLRRKDGMFRVEYFDEEKGEVTVKEFRKFNVS